MIGPVDLCSFGASFAHRFDQTATDDSALRQSLTIGDLRVALIHHSARSRAELGAALEHLEVPDDDTPIVATFRCGVGEGNPLPAPIVERLAVPVSDAGNGTALMSEDNCELIAQSFGYSWWNERSQSGLHWVDGESTPAEHQAIPLRMLLHLWGGHVGRVVLHGGAVGIGDDAMILAAPSGSGKSTLAVSALLQGMTFYGDDFVFLDVEQMRVESLFSSAKFDDRTLGLLGIDGTLGCHVGRAELGRSVIQLAGHEGIGHAGVVKAVVVPRITDEEAPSLTPIRPMDALRAITLTPVLLSAQRRQSVLSVLTAMCRDLPCFRLDTGRDPRAAAGLLGQLFD